MAQRAMRTDGIVVVAPGLKFFPNIWKIEEEVYVQAFVPETTVEALHEAVLDWPAWPYEVQLHASLVSPGIHGPTAKLGAVVHGDRKREGADIQGNGAANGACRPIFGKHPLPGEAGHPLGTLSLPEVRRLPGHIGFQVRISRPQPLPYS